MAKRYDAAAFAAKWKAKAGAAQNDYKSGVQNTNKDVIGLAVAAAPKWGAKVQEAVANGTYAKGLSKTNTAAWKAKASGKGATNYVTGVNDAAPDVQKYFQEAASVYGQIQTTMDGMPSITDADNDQRMLTNANILRQFGKSRKGM